MGFIKRVVNFAKNLLWLAGLGLLCSGCWPMRFATSPGASGVVRDAVTHEPIASATVGVSDVYFRYTYPPATPDGQTGMSDSERDAYVRAHKVFPTLSEAIAKIRPPVVVTGPDGHFKVPPIEVWGLYIMPMDVFPRYATLVVRGDGYEPATFYFFGWSTTNFGDIFLKPLPK